MRKLILAMQISLDGFVEGTDGDMSWLDQHDPEAWQDLFEMLETVDLFLLGRAMFHDYRNHWQQAMTKPTATANEVAYATLAATTKHIVFSDTLLDAEWTNTQILSGDIVEHITELKKQPGRDIQVVGGAMRAATGIKAGLVDEFRLNINPIILGSGKSFFKNQHTMYLLETISTKTLTSGVVVVRHKVKT